MGTFGSSKVAKNKTTISNDNRTQDNKVAADASNVISSAGGAITVNSTSTATPLSEIGAFFKTVSDSAFGGGGGGGSAAVTGPGAASSPAAVAAGFPPVYYIAGGAALLVVVIAVMMARRGR